MSKDICHNFRNYSTCEGEIYSRNGLTYCATCYRAAYSVKDMRAGINSNTYRVKVGA